MIQHRMRHFRPGRSPWGGPGRHLGHDHRLGSGRRFGPGRHFGPGALEMTPELRSLIGDVRGIGRYLFRQGMSCALNDTEKTQRLRDIIGRTRVEIEALFGPENSTRV